MRNDLCSAVYLIILAFANLLLSGPVKGADPVRDLPSDLFKSRLTAGWIGQMAGVGWAAPTEFKFQGKIMPEGYMPKWNPDMINQFDQDDIYVEMTFLRTLEQYGFDADIRQAGIDFANSEYRLWHANKWGREMLRKGIAPPDSGHPKFNSHTDDLDYQIEADYSGLISPGLPNQVIELGEKFGRLMNYGDGLCGGIFIAAMYSEAYFEKNIVKIIHSGLAAIPAESLYAEMVRDILKWYQEEPNDWKKTWEKIDTKYQKSWNSRRFCCSKDRPDYNIDAKINGAYVLTGLLYGKGDPDRTILIAARCGQDSDCNPSTAAGILFTSLGMENIPDKFYKNLDRKKKFSHTAYHFPALIEVCQKLTEKGIVRSGGRITQKEGKTVYEIPVQVPKPGPYKPSFNPDPIQNVRFTEAEQKKITVNTLSVWPADIHTKIFPDTPPGPSGDVLMKAAKNEYESAQIGLCSPEEDRTISISVSSLVHEDGKSKIPASTIRLRPIGLIPIKENTPGAESILIRKAPCEIPDVLFEDSKIVLKKGESKGIWITLFVPENAKSGQYTATIFLDGGSVKKEITLALEVFSFTLPSARHLWITNWHSSHYIAKEHKVSLWSEDFWPVLEKYFKNMADHRQNTVLTTWIPDDRFVKAIRKKDGRWEFDFSNLEHYLALAEKHGIADRIEFSFCGGINQQKNIIQFQNAILFDEKTGKNISVGFDVWCKPVLGALEKMLIDTNRIDRAMIHVADEPFFINMEIWRAASRRVHEAAPKIRRIDAIESINFAGELEVWVPKLTHFDRWRDAYEARRGEGEFWFYICCHPIGDTYPNRFMDLPASRNRVIHWINFTEHLPGYLRCGYNSWHIDPFGSPLTKFAPGDTHAVYPGPLDSIRWEIDREGIEDYEYLVLLRDLTAQVKKESTADLWWLIPENRSMEIGRRIVRSISDTELDPKKITDARLEIAREIEKLSEKPRLIVQTYPCDGSRVFAGPVVIEVYGLTNPGAVITVNGKPVPVKEDGSFLSSDWNEHTHDLEIIAAFNGRTTKVVRHFTGKSNKEKNEKENQ